VPEAFERFLMIAEFLGITSKSTFHGNPFFGKRFPFSEAIMDRQRDRHKVANIQFFTICWQTLMKQ
jgi:hypothetical protein